MPYSAVLPDPFRPDALVASYADTPHLHATPHEDTATVAHRDTELIQG